MFNDFKIRTYSTTQNKLRVLKDIFDRLNLFNFNKRLSILIGNVESLKKIKDEIIKNPPIPPTPTEFGFGEFLIIHAHNPEGIEIGGLITDKLMYPIPEGEIVPIYISDRLPKLYIDDNFICYTPQVLIEHNFPIVRLSDYGIKPGYHSFKCIFNNIESSLGSIYISKNSITNLIFEFERTEAPLYNWQFSGNVTEPDEFPFGISMHTFSPDMLRVYAFLSGNTNSASVGYTINPNIFSLNLSASGDASIGTVGYGLSYALHSWRNNLPINIPATTDFSEWFIQYNLEGYYPPLVLVYDYYSGIVFRLPEWPTLPYPQYVHLLTEPPDTHLDPIMGYFCAPASKNYTNLMSVVITPDIRIRQAFSRIDPEIPDNPNLSVNGEFLNGGLKFSSIPYDLEGLSF